MMAESVADRHLGGGGGGGNRRPSLLPDLATEFQLRQAEQRARDNAPSPTGPAPGGVPQDATGPTVPDELRAQLARQSPADSDGASAGVLPATTLPGDEEGPGAAQWPMPAQRRHVPRPAAAATEAATGALPAPLTRQWDVTAAAEGHSGTSTPPPTAGMPGGGFDAATTETLERLHRAALANERGGAAVAVAAASPLADSDIPSARLAAHAGVVAAQAAAAGGHPAPDNFWQHLQHFRPPARAADGRPDHSDVLQQLQQQQLLQQRQQQQLQHRQLIMVCPLPSTNVFA